MHGDSGIAEHGLRARSSHDQVPAAVLQRIAEVPQVALFLLRKHLEVGNRGVQHRVPVDQPLAPVDQAFVVQADEDFGNGG